MFQPLLMHQYLNITTDLDHGCKAQGQGLVITLPFLEEALIDRQLTSA